MTSTPVTSMPASLRSFTDAAADAVARAIANVQRAAEQDRQTRQTEHEARLSDLETRLASVAALEDQLSERLASLKDATDAVEPAIADVRRAAEQDRETRQAEHEARLSDLETRLISVADLETRLAERLASLKDGEPGEPGKPGEPGAPGAPGKLPQVRQWTDAVHYEGDVVAFEGRTFQALRDTGRSPGGDDWQCIAERGENARTFEIRGTWSEATEYQSLDVVALNGASFAAKIDNPGPCPGEGWQLIAAQGKRGNPGEPGRPGKPGDPGKPGLAVVAIDVDANGMLTLINGDGSTVQCDLYEMLTRIAK